MGPEVPCEDARSGYPADAASPGASVGASLSPTKGGGQVGMAGENAEFATISEIIRAARSRLPQGLWDHSAGGVGTETTLRRNRQAFETLAFRPRLLRM